MKPENFSKFVPVILGLGAAVALAGCTGQIPGSFRLQQQDQTFSSQLEINTKIDLLWVVDNSSSMDVSQDKLRKGFTSFARKYMQPTWDIRAAVITTDTYLADARFQPYLASKVAFTTGYASPYINSRLTTWVNPSWNPSLVNKANGKFDNGVSFSDLVPLWGPLFARLLPGYHDGPTTALCFEGLPYFINGVTKCKVRDNQLVYSGVGGCLHPNTAAGETSLTQCVNTVENDSVRSHKAIIQTMPPAGVAGDSAWTQQLIDDFMVNVTTGSAGHGSERGLGSVLQLIKDNEDTDTAFFRPGSLKGIIFVTDEDDQTFEIPANPAPTYNPWSDYKCDQASLLALNSDNPSRINGVNGLCCNNPANNCRYGANGTSCPSKTVDGVTYTVSICAMEDKLVPVSHIKDQLDSFFTALDGTPNYFVVSIVPTTGTAIQTLQSGRNSEDANAGASKTWAVDRADRYIELGDLVGNGSMAMNIADDDYTPILEAIGQAVIEKKGTFVLDRPPTGTDEMTVSVLHADGTKTEIKSDKFVISGKTLTISDLNVVLQFKSTDKISINYQPKTLF